MFTNIDTHLGFEVPSSEWTIFHLRKDQVYLNLAQGVCPFLLIETFLVYAEIGSENPCLSVCNLNMFYIVQCSHWVWNLNQST